MTELELIIRLAAGLTVGALIGLERQWRQRGAGLRTNALVATGACLFVLLSVAMDDDTSPTRIAAQVVSGVGFLGAGVILRDGVNVRGINTAATLWCSAAVGTLAGAGEYTLAFTGAAVVMIANLVLRPLAYRIDRRPVETTELESRYRFRAVCRHEDEAHIRALVLQSLSGYRLQSLYSEDLDQLRVGVNADLLIQGGPDDRLEHAVSRLSLEPGVSAVRWEILDDPQPELDPR
jgi:putative Mg2+ transporter-C (MgtC) family protein